MREFFARKTMKHYGFKSILLQNLITVFLVMMIPFSIVCSFTYINSQISIKNEEKTFIKERLDKMVQVNDNFFQNIGRISAALGERMEFRSVMNVEENKLNHSMNYAEIMNELNMVSMTHLYIKELVFYSPLNEQVITTTTINKLSDMENMQWISEYFNDAREFFVTPIKYQGMTTTMVVRSLKSGRDGVGGYLFVIIDNEVYKRTFNISSEDEKLLIYDKEAEQISFSTDGELYDAKQLRDMNIVASSKFNWDYYYQNESGFFKSGGRNNTTMIIIISICTLLLCALLAIVISIKTFAPIRSVMQYLSHNSDSDGLLYNDKNELSYIMRNLLQLVGEKEKLSNELENRMLLLNNAQIYALQYQINPHFIYNTLEAVKWLVLDVENEEEHTASDVINKMSKLFKYSLNMKNYLETLEREIQNTKDYIFILNVRSSNSFEVVWNISEAAKRHKIVKLSLQPLVENAVFHGLKSLSSGGVITIEADEVDGRLVVCVKDNGHGISNEALSALRHQLEYDDVFAGANLGLSNLQRRIKLICGEEYGITVEGGDGFTVRMILP